MVQGRNTLWTTVCFQHYVEKNIVEDIGGAPAMSHSLSCVSAIPLSNNAVNDRVFTLRHKPHILAVYMAYSYGRTLMRPLWVTHRLNPPIMKHVSMAPRLFGVFPPGSA